MKKFLICLLALALLCAGCVSALAEEKIVRVTGNAAVTLAADTATLQIGVNTKKDNVVEAQQENTRVINAVIEALWQSGVGEKDIITSSFNVYSGSDFSYDAQGKETRVPYYEVDNMLNVTVRDLSRIGAVLDAAVQAGANSTYGISFSSTQENEAYLKALTRAVEDAAAKAQTLAGAAGKTLGDLLLMDASQGNYYYGVSNFYDAKEASAGSAIVSGDVSVSATVVLEYEMK